MLRTHIPDRFVHSDIPDARQAANDQRPVKGQTDSFMFTRLFFVTAVVLGGLALASMLAT